MYKGNMHGNCVVCNKKIHFWQKTAVNEAWHVRCWKAHNAGGETMKRYINSLLRSLDYPSVEDLRAKVPISTAGEVYATDIETAEREGLPLCIAWTEPGE